MIIGATSVDYDESKEEQNRQKHGYSLSRALYLFERLVFPVNPPLYMMRDVSTPHELRHEHLIVDDDGRVLQIVTTMRDSEVVRVISLRPASRQERKQFRALTGYCG